jgi:stage II sporulation protein D
MDEQYGKLKKIKIGKRSSSGYILSLTVVFKEGERTYTRENDIRSALGKYVLSVELADGSKRTNLSSVPSACFEVTSQKNGEIVLTGGGFGHDIGMSQYGADAMGREGKDYAAILEYYYKGAVIQTI